MRTEIWYVVFSPDCAPCLFTTSRTGPESAINYFLEENPEYSTWKECLAKGYTVQAYEVRRKESPQS